MLNRILDIAKENYTLSLIGGNGNGNGDIDISYKGTIEDTANGKREEYTIVRWINKNEPRKSD